VPLRDRSCVRTDTTAVFVSLDEIANACQGAPVPMSVRPLLYRFSALAPLAFVACTSGSSAPPAPIDASVDAAPSAHANGTVEPWSTLAPMPVPRANHCSVTASGYLVVIGGNYGNEDGGFTNTNAVDVALLHADGSLGPWTQAGTTPSPVNSCTATAKGSTIYIVDGIYDDMSKSGQVFAASLSTGGMLGAWTSLGALPNGPSGTMTVPYSNAWITSDAASTLYVMDPRLDTLSVVATLHVPLEPSFGAWSEDDWLPGFLGHPQYAFTGAYFYVLGGYSSDDAGDLSVVGSVHGAPLESNGRVGSAFASQALPSPVDFGAAVAVDGWVFEVGGQNNVFAGPGIPNVVSAEVGSDGQLGKWATQPGLPQGRTSPALTLAGDFLYVTGGGYQAGGLDTVFAARVRF
jgi:hypothetical protein